MEEDLRVELFVLNFQRRQLLFVLLSVRSMLHFSLLSFGVNTRELLIDCFGLDTLFLSETLALPLKVVSDFLELAAGFKVLCLERS